MGVSPGVFFTEVVVPKAALCYWKVSSPEYGMLGSRRFHDEIRWSHITRCFYIIYHTLYVEKLDMRAAH